VRHAEEVGQTVTVEEVLVLKEGLPEMQAEAEDEPEAESETTRRARTAQSRRTREQGNCIEDI
jgi:hypothetical protein